MPRVEIELKRVQTFIFGAPQLKAMLGANALIGETMRVELSALEKRHNASSSGSPPSSGYPGQVNDDPLTMTPCDNSLKDDPAQLHSQGILVRDGGRFHANFNDFGTAKEFATAAQEKIEKRLPGVLFEIKIDGEPHVSGPAAESLPDLPMFQICEATGSGVAVETTNKGRVSKSTKARLDAGDRFYEGETKDMLGLLRDQIFPNGHMPKELNELAPRGYLALIAADGNNVGKRSKEYAGDPADKKADVRREHFYHSMRVAVRKAFVEAIKETFSPEDNHKRKFMPLMLGGDDIVLVCEPEAALPFLVALDAKLSGSLMPDDSDKLLTIGAGVAIAQDSFPFMRLHEMAEALAGSAKRRARAQPDDRPRSFVDWQVCTQSWLGDVAEARRAADLVSYEVGGEIQTLVLSAKPYAIRRENATSDLDSLESLWATQEKLKDQARSQLKSLRNACERGKEAADLFFISMPADIRATLKDACGLNDETLWEKISQNGEEYFLTRLLDIVDLSEIAHLGQTAPATKKDAS